MSDMPRPPRGEPSPLKGNRAPTQPQHPPEYRGNPHNPAKPSTNIRSQKGWSQRSHEQEIVTAETLSKISPSLREMQINKDITGSRLREVCLLMTADHDDYKIARILEVKPQTIVGYVVEIMDKVEIIDRAELVAFLKHYQHGEDQ